MTLVAVIFRLAVIADDPSGEVAVTLEQTATFLGAARTDLCYDAKVLHSGRTVVCGTAEVRDASGRLIGHDTLSYFRPTAKC